MGTRLVRVTGHTFDGTTALIQISCKSPKSLLNSLSMAHAVTRFQTKVDCKFGLNRRLALQLELTLHYELFWPYLASNPSQRARS